MKQKKISTLLIGLGEIGLNYDFQSKNKSMLTHAKSIIKHPDFLLVGAIDSSEYQRNIFKRVYKTPVFSSLKKALVKLKPDMVVVALPTKNHHDVINTIIKNYRPKIILCEKPFCNSYAESVKISKICKSKRIKLFINYGRHCLPGVIKIKSMISKNLIKSPIKGNVWFSRGYFNNGSHFIELLNNWMGPIQKIGLLYKKSKKIKKNKFVDFYIKFKKGIINFIENESSNYSHQSIELLSKNKRILWDHHENLYLQKIVKNRRYPKYQILDKNNKKIDLHVNKIQWHVYDEIAKVFKKKNYQICKVNDALAVSKVLFKIKKLI
jgi:predicted dehydrogenase